MKGTFGIRGSCGRDPACLHQDTDKLMSRVNVRTGGCLITTMAQTVAITFVWSLKCFCFPQFSLIGAQPSVNCWWGGGGYVWLCMIHEFPRWLQCSHDALNSAWQAFPPHTWINFCFPWIFWQKKALLAWMPAKYTSFRITGFSSLPRRCSVS